MNIADKLIERIIATKNPSVIGLDPDLRKIPSCYKSKSTCNDDLLAATADMIVEYNKDIIDTIHDLIPAVKPQMAFYEQYGSWGVNAFERTVEYAHKRGLLVIEDGKRNDIGNTAFAYANGHLGQVEVLNGENMSSFDTDFLTVSPFLGSEGLIPFINVCEKYDKGVFVLVKTSNSSAGEIQDSFRENGQTVSQTLASFISSYAETTVGQKGYSGIGAVVGATYPSDAVDLRKRMPKSIFLVPGYGAQGGSAEDIVPCFNNDGLGAIVNSSRGILYSHMSEEERRICTKAQYLDSVRAATKIMQDNIYGVLKKHYTNMYY